MPHATKGSSYWTPTGRTLLFLGNRFLDPWCEHLFILNGRQTALPIAEAKKEDRL